MLCQVTPYEGKAPYLFVSYCHKDQAVVYPLIEQLAADGCRIWYDDGNHGGDDWLVNIEDHLEGSAAFLAFISQASSFSHNCKSEVVYALKCRKKVLPVLLDEADMPKGLRMQLSYLHQLKRTDYPTDQALLHKICETAEIRSCMVRPEPQEKPKAAVEKPAAEPERKPPKKTDQKPSVSPVPPTAPRSEPKTQPKEPDMKPEKKRPSLKGWFSDKLNHKKTPDIDVEGVRVEEIPGKESWGSAPAAIWETETQLDQSPQDNGYGDSGFRPENIWDYESTVADPYLSKKITYEEMRAFEQSGRVPERRREPEQPRWEPDTGDRRRREPRQEEPKRRDAPRQKAASYRELDREDEDFQGEATVFDRSHGQQDQDKTVYDSTGSDLDKTVFGGSSGDEDDGDKTVRGSFRNFALLVHPAENRVYPLRLPQTKLGRSPIKCDVTIEGNDSISKLHAEIIQINRKCYLRDIHSSNGTFLYGVKLDEDQKELADVATFQLSDETLILISGHKARQVFNTGTVDFLINEALPEACVLSDGFILLNRSSQWPGGTLNDKRVHRHGHARVNAEQNGVYLVDETPQETNGTFLNGSRLRQGESRKLKPNDCIRVGDTTLVYKTMKI